MRVAGLTGEETGGSPTVSYSAHADVVRECQDCPLASAGRGVPGYFFQDGAPVSGPYASQADFMFIGEAPGPVEQEKGIPFVGSSGKLFHQLVKEAGISWYYVTNLVKHFPGRERGKIKAPDKEMIDDCWGFLMKEVGLVQPKWIVLLGKVAATAYLRAHELVKGNPSMGDLVGRTFPLGVFGQQALVLYHPAHFLYSGGARATQRQLNEFRRSLMHIRGEEVPEWPWTDDPAEGVIPSFAHCVVDCETEVAGKKPDPRYDTIQQVGLLPLDRDKALLFLSHGGPELRGTDSQRLIFHNAMYDLPLLQRRGDIIPQVEDTLAMAYSLGEQDLSLKGLGAEKLGFHTVTLKQVEPGNPNYLAQDVWLTRGLYEYFKPKLQGTAYEIDRQLIPILSQMIFRGYEIDQDMVEQEVQNTEARMDRLERAWYNVHPGVKISSPKQLGEHLHLPNTSKETLRALGTWEAEIILLWRGCHKLLTTYLRPTRGESTFSGLFNLYPSESGEGGAGTGRLSSRDHNMQNQHPEIQKCLRAPDGKVLVMADYSQMELRTAGELSDDEYLIGALSDPNRDLHQETADLLGLPSEMRGHPARWWGKHKWNFPVLYGAEAPFLAHGLGWTQEQVTGAFAKFRQEMWAGYFAWADRHWAEVQRTGYSTSPEPFLHKRWIPLLGGDHARKAAVNHPTQSMAAYITKQAMIEVAKDYPELVNQVHDSIHVLVDEDHAGQARQWVREAMVEVGRKYLPRAGCEVDVKVGRYWSG